MGFKKATAHPAMTNPKGKLVGTACADLTLLTRVVDLGVCGVVVVGLWVCGVVVVEGDAAVYGLGMVAWVELVAAVFDGVDLTLPVNPPVVVGVGFLALPEVGAR